MPNCFVERFYNQAVLLHSWIIWLTPSHTALSPKKHNGVHNQRLLWRSILVEAAGIEPASDEPPPFASTGLALLWSLDSAAQEAQPHCPAPLFSPLNSWCHCLRAAAWV